MVERTIVVAEGAATVNRRLVPAGMAHLAPEDDWHTALCGAHPDYQFPELSTLREAMASAAAAANVYPCGPCGQAARAKQPTTNSASSCG